MSTKEERDDFWQGIAIFAVVLLSGFLFGGGLFVINGVRHKAKLEMYEKLCPIEQVKGEIGYGSR